MRRGVLDGFGYRRILSCLGVAEKARRRRAGLEWRRRHDGGATVLELGRRYSKEATCSPPKRCVTIQGERISPDQENGKGTS